MSTSTPITDPPINEPPINESPVVKSPVVSPSGSASTSSCDMDEEGGVSLEEIMGFSDFNGTKREPKHGKKGRNGKSAAPVGTGANSQPVGSRQSFEMNDLSAPSKMETTSSKSVETDNSTEAVVGSTSSPNLPLQPTTNTQSQAEVNPDYLPVKTSQKRPHPDSEPQLDANAATSIQKSTDTVQPSTFDINSEAEASLPSRPTTFGADGRYRSRNQDLDPDAIGYTSPAGISMTNAELAKYAQGKVEKKIDKNGNEYEVKVYFQPSFIEDDPWAGLG